jgi:phosphonate transport system substrate-binding protein
MALKIVYLSKYHLILITTFLALLSGYLGYVNSEKKIIEIPNLITESIACVTHSATNNEKFEAFITDQPMAQQLLSNLCSNAVINRQFGKVEVHWSHNEQEISQYVGKGIANLALVKENVMQAFATQVTHGYKIIAQYQDYSAYLFSLKEKPLLTKQYLWGKRLGLLDYPSSRSGHIVPKRLLTELGIGDDNMQITYVKSHEALRDLLASGQVDLISSFWQVQDAERFSANYITPIETQVSGSKWYLKMPTNNTDLLCALQQSLFELSDEIHSQYYSTLKLTSFGCLDNEGIELKGPQNEP